MANVLLVEDDSLVRDTLTMAIKSKGHTVITAANGLDGISAYGRAKFDLVITDIIMPDMEGIGMILELRRMSPDVKIIAISGGGRTGITDFLTMAQKLGAVAILKKPIRLSDFLTTLAACLENAAGAASTVAQPRAAAR